MQKITCKNLTLFFTLIVSLFYVSCATTHPGRLGHTKDNSTLPIKVSARTVDSDPESTFELIEFTIENVSENWLKISHSKVLIDDPAKSRLSVVLGDDLAAWAEAAHFKYNQDAYNRSMLQSGLIGLGAAAVMAGGKGDVGSLGKAAFIGGTAWIAGDVVAGQYQSATGVETKPKNHLYEPMNIPGKMYIRRWVLLNKPAKVRIRDIAFQLEDINGLVGTYSVAL